MGLLDIEDIGSTEVIQKSLLGEPTQVKIHNGNVTKKLERLNSHETINGTVSKKDGSDEGKPSLCNGQGNDLVPADYSIYMKTWGCAHNSSDSEYMAGMLGAYGFKITDNDKEADVWILNSCTVKGPAEQHFKNYIDNGLKLDKKVILAGCVPQAEPRADFVKGFSIIGVQQIDQVIHVVEESLLGNTIRLMGKKKSKGTKLGGADLALPKIRKNPLIEIIPISTGCLNHCTYCKTKLARGELASYPEDEIISRAVQAFSEGVKEIWLTSEDTGAYGIDLGTNIVSLLRKLVEVIPQECMLRVGMTNPPYILNHLDDIAEILAHPRVYSFLHVPVQSGSDCVLADMKREYCIADFQNVVNVIKRRIPSCTIATDIICGFPTETKEDFEQTLELCGKNKFKVLFINQFYPRNGTVAARMKRIDTAEVKRRTKLLTDLFNSYAPYENRIGEVYDILVTEVSHDKNYFVGHNKFYEQILVPKNDELMGKQVRVKITSVCKHSMTGKIIKEHWLTRLSYSVNIYLVFMILAVILLLLKRFL